MSLKKALKEKFDFDVSALPDFTKETMPDIITDLIGNSDLLSRLTIREGIKGSERINLLNGDVELQAKLNCQQSPDGAFIFTDEVLEVVPLYMGIEFCNEDLVGKVTEMLLQVGMKMQEGKLPAELETIIMAYLMKLLMRKLQRLVILGDTTSIDPELALTNGLRYRINNNTDVVDYMSGEATIDDTNAYDIAFGLFEAVPDELFDNGMTVEIWTGRDVALKILKSWNQANPYTLISVPANESSMEFDLPLTNIRVVSVPELRATNEMWAVPLRLAFVGTDAKDDWSFTLKYDDYRELLKAEAKFRAGTQMVWGQYFTRLQLAVS